MQKFYFIFFNYDESHRFRFAPRESGTNEEGYFRSRKMMPRECGESVYGVNFFDTEEECQKACDRINNVLDAELNKMAEETEELRASLRSGDILDKGLEFVKEYIKATPEERTRFAMRINDMSCSTDDIWDAVKVLGEVAKGLTK